MVGGHDVSRTRRWVPWLVLGAVAVVVLAIGVQRSGHLSLDQETQHIAGEVRCPVCEGQSAAQSDSPASQQIRTQIHQELAAGQRQGQILSALVAAYGPGILEKPEAQGVGLVVWVVPVIAVILAIAGLGAAFARWRPRQGGEVSDADRTRVERALRGAAGPGASPGDGAGADSGGAGDG
jgi:cytochrome c-type biogenesis protein CcmH